MIKQYICPTDTIQYPLFIDMLNQKHLLIAGATGSGKSVCVNGLIYTAIAHSPVKYQFILLDPKRVELIEFRDLPHTIYYASEPDTMRQALESAMSITESRYKIMQKERVKLYTGSAVYIIIDELADLMTTDKKHVMPLIQRLAQIGRAANVHLIACTQSPISAVIPTPIKVNFDSRVGLRTRSAQDSRNILGCKGCETLPPYGYGYYMSAQSIDLYKIPVYQDDYKQCLLDCWTRYRPSKKHRFLRLFR